MDGRETLVGRYELRGMLGCGGMAEVREAWDTRLNRAVAIKLLHPALRVQPDIRRRFEAEASAAASLIHPNIVSVYDCGEHDGTPFIVMERLPGDTLADQLANGPLPPEWVRSILCDVLSALAVAHEAGVLHRDIKPGNILLSASGDCMKVADFGIAKTGGGAKHTVTGDIVGTLAYMSPERVAGAPASAADDLYAAGVTAYEALVGGRAFPHDNPASLARAIVDDPPPPLSTFYAGIDPTLAAVIDRAMARDLQQRFASAEQMRTAVADDGYFAGGAVPPTGSAWPATRLTAVAPHPVASPTATVTSYTAGVPARQRDSRYRRTAILSAAGAFAALSVSVLALSLATPSTTQPAEPVGATSVVPVPASAAPPPPAPPPVPAPSVSPPSPIAAVPVADQPPPPPIKQGNDNGNGNGKGNADNPGRKNGHGGKKS